MKKKNLKGLTLNKKSISELSNSKVTGGNTTSYAPRVCYGTLQEYCTGSNCTVGWVCDLGTHPV